MLKRLSIIIAVGAITLVSAAVLADESEQVASGYKPFSVVFVDNIDSDGEKASIRNRATKSRIASIQEAILSDPVLADKLRARGIQIRNIIGREEALDGATIFYLR